MTLKILFPRIKKSMKITLIIIRISYREWGIHELLNASDGYKVKKVTVFPGMSMNLHQHESAVSIGLL